MTGRMSKYWRRILASSAVYAAAGWAAVEALTTVIERFGLPPALIPLVTALYVAGLPVTIYLVWRTAGKERHLNWPSFAGAVGFLVAATALVDLVAETSNRSSAQREPGEAIDGAYAIVTYHVSDQHDVSVLYGRRLAGFICVGGVCRLEPEFDGVEVRLLSRF